MVTTELLLKQLLELCGCQSCIVANKHCAAFDFHCLQETEQLQTTFYFKVIHAVKGPSAVILYISPHETSLVQSVYLVGCYINNNKTLTGGLSN